ncbi:arsenosugar biosynthesis radical SAM protein ArsS [candidate division KSB1 bacterium]|nr:arsenosugar biosynthesis radical SAM protein ArsS [candidate division KSB1 bacterium]
MASLKSQIKVNPPNVSEQIKMLDGAIPIRFDDKLASAGLKALHAEKISTLQVNVGRLCNLRCRHCHVDAGPDRREIMPREVFQECLNVLDKTEIPVIDLTGGAPELNPNFRWFVEEVKRRGRHVMDRCNLTILATAPMESLPEFLAQHEVEIVASLPFFLPKQTNAQRGEGVFEKSIRALQKLNSLGYGHDGSNLKLDLVYNPVGAFLAPPQSGLEEEFKQRLLKEHNIRFHRLFCINNMPINRFLNWLIDSDNYEGYLERLVTAFNPHAAQGVMCRSGISVDWRGFLYDCDFNQMLDLRVNHGVPSHIRDWCPELTTRVIETRNHCYGCTAGSGSSCTGATI